MSSQMRILVTGATRGIGRATAGLLASHGHDVVVGGRDKTRVAALASELGGDAFVADLTDGDALATAATSVGDVDAVIHAAGIVPSLDIDMRSALREVFEVNVIAVMHLTELLMPTLRSKSGTVLFVNSGSGLRAMGDTGGYSASKFALTSYADGLRERERGRVRVLSVHPGRVDTDMQRDLQARQGRPYEASEHLPAQAVAQAIVDAVEAPAGVNWETLSIRPS